MEQPSSPKTSKFVPVILAGGSGTRFWPRSRKAKAKQVLALDGERTMIQQTVDRLALTTERKNIWVITNSVLAETIKGQLPEVQAQNVICEPAARNTAPACGLAAFLLEKEDPETVLGIFPSDHVVKDAGRFAAALRAAVAVAAAGENIVVLGVPPTRPETGYGYIEQGDVAMPAQGLLLPVRHVHRFTEKPDKATALEFMATGRYAWNSGIFIWSACTLANALREHVPQVAIKLEEIAAAYGTPEFDEVFAKLYPECDNISIDYAVLEPRSGKGEQESGIYCLPAEFGWNDLGSWAALHEHQRSIAAPGCDQHGNVVDAQGVIALASKGNYVYAKDRTIALVGVNDMVVVETDDAILVTTREHSQDVGKVVKALQELGRKELI